MNRIDRLFGILTLLQSKKYGPAENIAEKFNISVRTVYRDIKALCEQGVPMSFEQKRGYFIVNGYFLPPVAFSSDEANALLLMERMVSGFADISIQKHYSSALCKIKAVLRGKEKDKLEFLDNNIKFQVHEKIRPDFEYLSVLQQAIISQHVITLSYKNNNQEISERNIEPIGLVYYAFGWHLIGWCHLRADYRDFKVQRILHIRGTEIPFSKTNHISLDEYMTQLPVNY